MPSPQAQVVWRRTLKLAEPGDGGPSPAVLFDVLRAAAYDTARLSDALVLGRSRAREHPTDLNARRACTLLARGILFMGGSDGTRRSKHAG